MTHLGRPALPQAFFLPVEHAVHGAGQRFCLFHVPQGPVSRGRVLYLHPFAEELNSTRRMAAQQARAMAEAGYAVLQIDLMGCGDSSGEFSDPDWSDWMNDALMAERWLGDCSSGPLWIWGMRSGALLATELIAKLSYPANLLLWQPVISGEQMLQQFIRLHAAGQWLSSEKTGGPSPAHLLANGQSVEIAGYTVTSKLAQGLSEARLRTVNVPATRHLVWVEVSSQAQPVFNASVEKELNAWREAGWEVHERVISGPAFWQNVTGDDVVDLVKTTLKAMAIS